MGTWIHLTPQQALFFRARGIEVVARHVRDQVIYVTWGDVIILQAKR